MRRLVDMLSRHGLAVLLAGAAVCLYIGATLPALEARADIRARRRAAEADVDVQRQAVRQAELWLQGSHEDPMLIERMRDSLELSPELVGPRVTTAPAPSDEAGVTEDR